MQYGFFLAVKIVLRHCEALRSVSYGFTLDKSCGVSFLLLLTSESLLACLVASLFRYSFRSAASVSRLTQQCRYWCLIGGVCKHNEN